MTKGSKILFIVFIGLLACGPIRSNCQSASVAVVPGWRLPEKSDIKEQWTEKYWTEECRKAEEANRKGADDAIEEIGSGKAASPTNDDSNNKVECWKPDFPVHVGVGDYNGDGIPDEARILISTKKGGGIGIFVFLGTKAKKPDIVSVKTMTHAKATDYFVGTTSPGEKIDTACGKGYWDCGAAEPKAITLKRDGIIFGQFESWSAIAYWDSRLSKFKVVPISD